MVFTIETKVSKNGKPFNALMCNGRFCGFVNRQAIDVEAWKEKLDNDEIGLTDYTLKIKMEVEKS